MVSSSPLVLRDWNFWLVLLEDGSLPVFISLWNGRNQIFLFDLLRAKVFILSDNRNLDL